MSSYQVVKYDGRREAFSEDKLMRSASRVGVPANLQPQLLRFIESRLYDGISTREIFRLIKNFLHHHPRSNLRYNLKKALAELGPSGYPFEKYLAQLLALDGYQTRNNIIMQGKCVTHEIDVVAVKNGTTYAVEAKFHNRKHLRSDVKVSLYVHSRYLDLLSTWKNQSTKLEPWLITNTRFTLDARNYALCVGMKIMSWDYPTKNSLRERIERSQLYPITILETINQHTLNVLIESGIVTYRQVLAETDKLKQLLSAKEYQQLLAEIKLLA